MKQLIAASATLLLTLSQTAFAGSDAPQVAQADTGTSGGPALPNAGSGATRPGAASGPTVPSVTAPAQTGTPGGASTPATITPLPTTAAPIPAPAQQATAPAPDLAPPQYSGTQRNNAVTTPSALTPSTGPLPFGGTQATVGVPSPVPAQPYGGTQRDSAGSVYGDLQAHGGVPSYSGTQATLGAPQNLGGVGQPGATDNSQLYGAQPYGAQPYGIPQTGSTQRNGTQTTSLSPGASPAYIGSAPGNGTVYSRAPAGSVPYTRDQTGVFGGVGSYDARGVYTGVAPQPGAFGQIYAPQGGVIGGTRRSIVNATAPVRSYVPSAGGPGPTNSGYGIPNGSKETYMDARGIQRTR